MKKNLSQTIILCLVFCFGVYSFAAAEEEMSYEELKKAYNALVIDRDNILAQTKNLLQFKEKSIQLEKDIEELSVQNQELTQEIKTRIAQIQTLQHELEELENEQAPLMEERERLKNSLEKFQIEYRILPETKKKVIALRKENAGLSKSIKQAEREKQRLQEEYFDVHAQSEIYRRQLNEFKDRYDQALEKNRDLEKQITKVPQKFAQLARENKILIKQTALMHYNLGVFYTENKQYARAIAEFEKAIELNPDDPYAYYNLGYIYAEYLVDRQKAIEEFRNFLRLSKSDDKDVDWVKKYILTWQTWEANRPLK